MNRGAYGFPIGRSRQLRQYHRTRAEKLLSNQNAGTGAWVLITFDSVAHDDDGMWNINLPGQLTVYTPGVWVASAGTVETAPLAEGSETHLVGIYKNGFNGERIGIKGNERMFSGTMLNTTGSARFKVGDYVSAYFYADGGTGILLAQPAIHLSMEWVSP